FFFSFQAEDGIRDFHVTGVQTCALPISHSLDLAAVQAPRYDTEHHYLGEPDARAAYVVVLDAVNFGSGFFPALRTVDGRGGYHRSEERRVGKECRYRWVREH